MVEDFVTVDIREYRKMKEDLKFLEALKAAGVDNWEGYDAAIEIFENE